MGQTLSEPLTTKHSATCENAKYKVGSSSMQGWRVTMEDAHTHILELPDEDDTAFFGVYDGHGGSVISKYVSNNIHKCVVQRVEYKDGNIPAAFTTAFLELDETMQNDDKLKNEISGTTAVTCLIKGNKLYCANVGDSRAVACINGTCHPLSFDHKPQNPSEEARIREAGGFVEFNRVNGNLALSRALGDFAFKQNPNKTPEQQMVCAVPDVEERTITEDWEFIILACDGIWDVLTNEEACELVRYPLANCVEPDKVCEKLLQTCLAPDCNMGGLGCDNMTMVLICLLHEQSWSEYCLKMASSLNSKVDYQRRMRSFSIIDTSSSSDDDDVILSDRSQDENSIAASLCASLSVVPPAGAPVVDTEDLQKVLQSEDYIYRNEAGDIVTVTENQGAGGTSTSANKIGGLIYETLPAENLQPTTTTTTSSSPNKPASGKGKPKNIGKVANKKKV